jgi:hypothetical protein
MTITQHKALQNVRAKALHNQEAATQRIAAIIEKHGLDTDVAAIAGKIRDTGVGFC